jgi:hypothetical protein
MNNQQQDLASQLISLKTDAEKARNERDSATLELEKLKMQQIA